MGAVERKKKLKIEKRGDTLDLSKASKEIDICDSKSRWKD